MKLLKRTIQYFILILIFLLISSQLIYAQNRIDSLEHELRLNQSNDENRLKVLIALSDEYSLNNPKKGIKLANEAIEIAGYFNDIKSKSKSFANIGLSYWTLEDYPKAHNYLDSSYYYAKMIKDSASYANYYLNKGLVLYYQNSHTLAMKNYLKAIKIAKIKGLNSTEATCLMNVAIIYHDIIKDSDKALENYYAAKNKYKKIGRNTGLLYNNIASLYLDLNKLDSAFTYLNKAIVELKKKENLMGLGYVYLNLGFYYKEVKNFDKSLYYLNSSLGIMKELGQEEGILKVLKNIGLVYKDKKEYNPAIQYFNKALTYSTSLHLRSDVHLIYNQLSEIYVLMNNYKAAHKYSKLYADSSLSYLRELNLEKVSKLQTEYETNEKKTENELLKTKLILQKHEVTNQKLITIVTIIIIVLLVLLIFILNKNKKRDRKSRNLLIEKNKEINKKQIEIKKKNRILEKVNATKDKFFSILAHDLKNPFGVVINFSTMLKDDFETLSYDEKKEITHQIYSSVIKVNYLLDNLLTWSRSSRNCISVNKHLLSAKKIIESATKPYEEFANSKQIFIKNHIPADLNIYTDKYIFETIIGNLVNNAIKFSPIKSNIIVGAKKDSEKTRFYVKDYGVGMDEKTANNVFDLVKVKSTLGTIGEKGTGLGLVLVKDFVDKIGGKINIESKVNEGSIFNIILPNK